MELVFFKLLKSLSIRVKSASDRESRTYLIFLFYKVIHEKFWAVIVILQVDQSREGIVSNHEARVADDHGLLEEQRDGGED